MTFEYPYLLLLLFPLFYCLYRCKEKIVQGYFVHLDFFTTHTKLLRWEWILKITAVLFLMTAVASPIIIDKTDPLNRKGIDIVLSIDGSGSMNASGFDENSRDSRFEITQKIAQDFVMKRYEDNVGVVLFGDFAFIASPVTYEKEIVSEMIGYLSHGMAGQNTAIGEGIVMGLRALKESKAKSRVVILLTDGEHNSGRISPKEATELAKQEGIKIYTIGIGNKGEFDKALLEKIAEESGGHFFAAYNKEELQKAYEEIDAMEQSRIKSREFQVKEYYFQWPLLGALAVLLFILWQRSRA
ncbi:VWA domain-containing protein [Sulfurimonas sp. HSL3-7]|uniref:VWA domain-containing protein n=1 Tax=Sulfonitrofixus jiaomeiensis TaxID=3131938 RepID=UPI0031F83639